tara:strand:- start:754 stop:1131 length:378 start_codon:yes stop_codon:yes gene_type:complete
MASDVKIDYSNPDKVLNFVCGSCVQVKNIGDKTSMRIEMVPGFNWRESISPKLPNQPLWCPATHFGFLSKGTMRMEFEDGSKMYINAGDSYLIDKPHIPIIEGNESAVMFEYSQQVKKVVDSIKE